MTIDQELKNIKYAPPIIKSFINQFDHSAAHHKDERPSLKALCPLSSGGDILIFSVFCNNKPAPAPALNLDIKCVLVSSFTRVEPQCP